MIVMLKDASNHWCPKAQVTSIAISGNQILSALPAYNRLDVTKDNHEKEIFTTPGGTGCIGDKCMAWQWITSSSPLRKRCANQHAVVEEDAGPKPDGEWTFIPYDEGDGEIAFWREATESAKLRRQGQCGAFA